MKSELEFDKLEKSKDLKKEAKIKKETKTQEIDKHGMKTTHSAYSSFTVNGNLYKKDSDDLFWIEEKDISAAAGLGLVRV